MAEKELRKLNRRELLRMLLVQCEESERLQQELDEITERFETMSESYERLKKKLDIKDERLNQKDLRIGELEAEVDRLMAEAENMENFKAAGSAAEAADRLSEIFREAQREAEEYLRQIRTKETGRAAAEAKKKQVPKLLQSASSERMQPIRESASQPAQTEFVSLDIAAGVLYG